jgi:pyruvate carboxylase subunit A
MISMLRVWAPSRIEAIHRMDRALYEYVVVGVTTNIPFHKAVIRHDQFIKGNLTTHFIEDNSIIEHVKRVVKEDSEKGATLASALENKPTKVAAVTAAVESYMQAAKKQSGKE